MSASASLPTGLPTGGRLDTAGDEAERLGVAIVGAGFAGLGAGIRLARAGREDFAIVERSDGVGGTWHDNVYPGVACDIPSRLYSYSFRPEHPWSRIYAPGHEIRDYLETAAREEGLVPRLRLNEALSSARWDEASGSWSLTTSRGRLRSRVLVLAAGRLSEPKVPDIPGLGSFPGRVFHSARWDDRPLDGLRVGVVGTGASAVQLLPRIAEKAAHVTVFQRSAPWVLPRGDREWMPGDERPGRDELSAEAERLFEARIAGSPAVDALRRRAQQHLDSAVPDEALRALLTPDYEIGCKRALFSDDWYPALQRANVALEPSALARVDGGEAVSANGTRHRLDVLVFATGFETTHPPYAPLVMGREETLAEHWADGMRSHASTAIAGFPNLFVLDGPNSALGHHSAIEVIEAQLDHLMGALDHLDDAGADAVLEATPAAEQRYTELVDELAAPTVWMQGGCSSWYRDAGSGRLTTLWPGTVADFRARNARFDPAAFELRIPNGVGVRSSDRTSYPAGDGDIVRYA